MAFCFLNLDSHTSQSTWVSLSLKKESNLLTVQAGKVQVELLTLIIAQFQQLLQCNAAINNVISARGESKESKQGVLLRGK